MEPAGKLLNLMEVQVINMRISLILLCLSFLLKSQILLTENFNNFIPDSVATSSGVATDSLKKTYYFKTFSATLDTHDYTGTFELTARTGGIGDSVLNNSPIVSGNNSVYFDGTDDQYEILDGSSAIQLSASPFTWSGVVKIADFTGYLYSKGDDYGFRLSNSANNAKGFFTRLDDGPDRYDKHISSTTLITYNEWVQITYVRAANNAHIYVNGTEIAGMTETGTYADVGGTSTAADFEIGSIVNVQELQGYYACLQYWDDSLSVKQIRDNVFLADGWVSLSEGAWRNNFAFHQGIIADTVYYNTSLTPGGWNIIVNVDGEAGGESLKVLTSSDALTWITLKTIPITTTATDYDISGIGQGYIGFGLATIDTVYIDNLTVTLANSDFSLRNLRKDRRLRRLSH